MNMKNFFYSNSISGKKKFLVDKMNDNKREKFNRWKKCCRNASKKLIESDKVIEYKRINSIKKLLVKSELARF